MEERARDLGYGSGQELCEKLLTRDRVNVFNLANADGEDAGASCVCVCAWWQGGCDLRVCGGGGGAECVCLRVHAPVHVCVRASGVNLFFPPFVTLARRHVASCHPGREVEV